MLTVQGLTEFFHATTRRKLLHPARAGAFVRDWPEVFDVASADGTALVDAKDAVEHRLSFWDAMLWATAWQAGCAAILRRLGGVAFINPFAAEAAARLAALLEA